MCIYRAVGSTLAAAGFSLSFASTPQQVFRTAVDLTVIDVVATDRTGAVVAGLSAADFEVIVDGRAAPIAFFEDVRLPAASGRRLGPQATSGAIRASNEQDQSGRLVVVIYDDAGAPVTAGHFQRVKGIVSQITDRLGPADQIAMVSTSGRRAYQFEFTSDPALIRHAFDRPILGESNGGDSPLDVMARVMAQLEGGGARRKLIVFIGPGGQISGQDYERIAKAAHRANAAVYAFDPRLSGNIDSSTTDETVEARAERAELFNKSVGGLRALAEITGGLAFANTNLFETAVVRMFDESGRFYRLGIPSTSADSEWHSIEVRVRVPGVEVRHRRGVTTPAKPGDSSASALTQRLLAAPFQRSGLPLRLAAVALPAPQEVAPTVAWTADIQAPLAANDNLELKLLVLDMDARVRVQDHYASTLPEGVPTDAKRWFRIAGRFSLPPGRYQMRLAVVHQQGDHGSVFSEFSVPAMDGLRTSSGIAFVSLARNDVSRASLLPSALGGVPMGRDYFLTHEAIDAIVPVRSRAGSQAVVFTWVIFDVEGSEVWRNRSQALASALQRGFVVRAPLPLKLLKPGNYRVHLGMREGARTESREQRFTVR